MRAITIDTDPGNQVAHVLYDTTIADINERRSRAQHFRSAMAVAQFLGVYPQMIFKYRKPGSRITSKKDGKQYAVRIAQKQTA